MDIDAVKAILAHSDTRANQLALAVLFIVDAIKEQPGFDARAFERSLVASAALFPEDDNWFLRLVLDIAAGKPLANIPP